MIRIVLQLLGLATAAVCAIVVTAEQSPGSRQFNTFLVKPFPLANARLAYAEKISSNFYRRNELPAALVATEQAIEIAPDRLRATLVLNDVLIAMNSQKLNREAEALLARSYDLSSLDYSYGVGRTRLAYNHWSELTPGLRQSVYNEVACLRPYRKREIDGEPSTVRDPSGAIAAELNLRRARRHPLVCIPTGFDANAF